MQYVKEYSKFLDSVQCQKVQNNRKFSVKQPLWVESRKNSTDRGISKIFVLPGAYDP